MSLDKMLGEVKPANLKLLFLLRDREKELGLEESNQERAKVRALLTGKVVDAKVQDYLAWLKGYFREGDALIRYRDYPLSREGLPSEIDRFFVATADFAIAPLSGANAIHIIVPENIQFLGGKLGHNHIYFMDGYRHLGRDVPVYSDMLVQK